jgi:hypothetical protein
VRPVLRASILSRDGQWRAAEFLVDTAADRTVLSAGVLAGLNLPSIPAQDRISGISGPVNSIVIATALRLFADDGTCAVFRGEFAACEDLESLDLSVLGRDVLDMFAVIVDRRGDVVTLVGQGHRYAILSD